MNDTDYEIETIDLIASGYDWICPHCDEDNHIIEIPSDWTMNNELVCEHCKQTSRFLDFHHAFA